jgi:hypothetical protein
MNWRGLITERDDVTPCFVRILTVLGVLGFVCITVYAVIRGQQIAYSEWAIGFTTIVAGGAGAARMKLDTEGKECDQSH